LPETPPDDQDSPNHVPDPDPPQDEEEVQADLPQVESQADVDQADNEVPKENDDEKVGEVTPEIEAPEIPAAEDSQLANPPQDKDQVCEGTSEVQETPTEPVEVEASSETKDQENAEIPSGVEAELEPAEEEAVPVISAPEMFPMATQTEEVEQVETECRETQASL